MTFCNHVFRIINCDMFTRKFLTEKGIKLNPMEDMPVDAFESYKKLEAIKIKPPNTKEYKEYYEVVYGGGHPNDGL